MSVRPPIDVPALAERLHAGDRAALARAITLVESTRSDHRDQAQALLERLLPHTGGARRVGISGMPGAGKSTFIDTLGMALLDDGHRVAVLAVDPSSTRSHGSVLGDKTRMARLATAQNAFIRPSPSAGDLGGVHRRTRETLLLCEAAGFDVVLVETVGVGQSETTVADLVDTFLVLLIAGGGDGLQGIKRGILELVDILVVNKADGEAARPAERARREYEAALHLMRPATPGWTTPVLTCSALNGTGVREVWAACEAHRAHGTTTGALVARRREQQRSWMWTTISSSLLDAFRASDAVRAELPRIEREVVEGTVPATRAAESLLARFLGDAARRGGD